MFDIVAVAIMTFLSPEGVLHKFRLHLCQRRKK